MTRPARIGLSALIAFAIAFLVAGVAVGGSSDRTTGEPAARISLTAAAALPALAEDPAVAAREARARREARHTRRVRARRRALARRRARPGGGGRRDGGGGAGPAGRGGVAGGCRAGPRHAGTNPGSGAGSASRSARAESSRDLRRLRMRLAVRKSPWHPLEEGSVVDGYVVDAAPDVHTRPEALYAVTAPDGGAATLVAPRRPYADRFRSFRVRRLARLRLELTHPALIPLRAVGEYEGQPYLVTDVQPRRTFDDLLEEKAPHESELLLAMLRPVAEALDLAHSHGLVHQELSGESLLLAGDRLMLDSFGLFASGWEDKWDNVHMDDVRYRSPEQMLGEPLGPAANVYSLAALVVHVLTGAPPYQGPRPAVTYGHMAQPPPLVSERRPELGAAVDEVIAWGMAKDPSERPRSAMALLKAVEQALGGTVPAGLRHPRTVAVSAVPEAFPPVRGTGGVVACWSPWWRPPRPAGLWPRSWSSRSVARRRASLRPWPTHRP